VEKILFVEDEKIFIDIYKEVFSQAGYEMISAIDHKEGLKLTKERRPDLIILDILIAGNGISFLEEWKKDPEISSIPVVAFSNYDDPKTKEEAFKYGVKAYLLKSDFTPQQFVKKIKTYL